MAEKRLDSPVDPGSREVREGAQAAQAEGAHGAGVGARPAQAQDAGRRVSITPDAQFLRDVVSKPFDAVSAIEFMRLWDIANRRQQYVQGEVPAGWRLVPAEATKEMLEAGDRVLHDPDDLADVYLAMLDAAPGISNSPMTKE